MMLMEEKKRKGRSDGECNDLTIHAEKQIEDGVEEGGVLRGRGERKR